MSADRIHLEDIFKVSLFFMQRMNEVNALGNGVPEPA